MKKVYLAVYFTPEGIEEIMGAFKERENAQKVVNEKREKEFEFWKDLKETFKESVNENIFNELYWFGVLEMDIEDQITHTKLS